MSELLSVQSLFFTVFGYPVSYIEFAGTVLYLWSVWLISKRHVLTWPVGIVSVVLYAALFYQIRLYSDLLEQVYYLGAGAYGWWYWSRSEPASTVISDVRYSGCRTTLAAIGITLALSAVLGFATSRFHLWWPTVFPEAASYAWVDALTTIMSFTAMALMVAKRIESWIYWIIVDVIGIWLYFAKDVLFVSLLCAILLVLAINGLFQWQRAATPATRPERDTAVAQAQ